MPRIILTLSTELTFSKKLDAYIKDWLIDRSILV